MRLLSRLAPMLLLTAALAAQGSINFTCSDQSGSQTKLVIDLNHNASGVADVWVDGVKLNGDQWSSNINGTKVTITFTNPPAKDKNVTVKINYTGSEPTVQGHTWS